MRINYGDILVFAHRGANSFAPENSLQAFEEAIRINCHGIEMDVRLTGSGDLVIFHDRSLYRMTGQKGSVHQLETETIRKYYLNGNAKYKIPTLNEALDLIRNKAIINLEIKREFSRSNGFEEKIIKILKDFNLKDNIIVSSYNPLVLKKIAAIASYLHLGFIYRSRTQKIMTIGTSLKSLHVNFRTLSKKYLKTMQEKGYRVFPWTVDRISDMKHFVEIGVDGIITNRPEVYFEMVQNTYAAE
jgi:glycerophosphoryl diester phosphodiesterase